MENNVSREKNIMKIRLPIRIAGFAVLSFIISLSVIIYLRVELGLLKTQYVKIVEEYYPSLESVDTISRCVYSHQALVFHYMLNAEDVDKDEFYERIDGIEKTIFEELKKTNKSTKGTILEEYSHDVSADINAYFSNVDMALEFYEDGDEKTAIYYVEETLKNEVQTLNIDVEELNNLVNVNVREIRTNMRRILKMEEEVIVVAIIILMLSLIFSLIFCLKMSSDAVDRDNLTKVYNFDKLLEVCKKYLKKGKIEKYNIIAMSIKDFKLINQEYGSQNGDNVLKAYAALIASFVSKNEIVARNGADNFFVLKEKETTEEFLNKVLELRVHVIGDLEIPVFTRCGVCAFSTKYTIQDHISAALLSLEDARKSKHKDVFYFTDEDRQRVLKEREYIASFEQALHNEQFHVYYQPKVDLETNKIVGAEALVRWVIDGKVIPPFDFIPILERENKITKLDFYVFDKACQKIRDWLDRGIKPVRISTNFSKEHLSNENLAKELMAIVEKYDIPSRYIEVEITESSAYGSYDELARFVDEMKEHKIYVAMDDFGTAYSSLSMLMEIDMDVIKLDRSFLMRTGEGKLKDKKNRRMIEDILKMLHDLDKIVICEGVETQENVDFLKSIGCRFAQGYLFDKPIPEDEFIDKWLNNR
ncbi:MAG: GGDEF domain-containing phosphodiesterase [Lachnospiraceae bacterium]|nr:GGDEF domain-containing phosphodiesterase [Lachnospiraceae bacterium]